MWSYKFRIDNILLRNSHCEFFYIDRENDWCIKKSVRRGTKLAHLNYDELYSLIENLEDFPDLTSYKTKRNIEDIKKEFLIRYRD